MIKANKIDVATDLYGGFLTTKFDLAYKTVGERMKETVAQVLGSELSNFLTLGTLGALETQDGMNNLNSCF